MTENDYICVVDVGGHITQLSILQWVNGEPIRVLEKSVAIGCKYIYKYLTADCSIHSIYKYMVGTTRLISALLIYIVVCMLLYR